MDPTLVDKLFGKWAMHVSLLRKILLGFPPYHGVDALWRLPLTDNKVLGNACRNLMDKVQ